MPNTPEPNVRNAVRAAMAHLSAALTVFLAGSAAASQGWVVSGLILMSIAVLYLIYELVASKPIVKNVPGMFRVLIAIFALVIFGGLNHAIIKELLHAPIIAPEFSQLFYSKYRQALGRPTEDRIPTSLDYAGYERAKIIWADAPNMHFILNLADDSWFMFSQADLPHNPNVRAWHDDECLKLKFPNCSRDGFLPPTGGIANELYWWSRDKPLSTSQLSQIGCRVDRDCVDKSGFIQHFQHGVVIGVLPQGADETHGLIYVLIDKQAWRSELVDTRSGCATSKWDQTLEIHRGQECDTLPPVAYPSGALKVSHGP